MRPDHEDPLGPAIRDALRESRHDCPEAETLAAFVDRALDRAQRRDVERHLSACTRCRETLLLLSRAADAETPASSGSRFRLYSWPWLAGAAAAALAVIVWTTTGQREFQSQSPPAADAVQPIGRDVGQEQAPASADSKVAAAPPAARESRGQRLADASRRRDEPKEEAPAARAPEARKPAATAELPAPPPPAAPSPVMAERDASASNRTAKQSGAQIVATRPQLETFSAAAGARWRILAPDGVERSADGGKRWSREPVEAPGARAIHSPSPDVCWLVGNQGLVMRYDPASGWKRVAPPAQADFAGVEAVDARRATITTSDGRRFTTADGGVSWMQEN